MTNSLRSITYGVALFHVIIALIVLFGFVNDANAFFTDADSSVVLDSSERSTITQQLGAGLDTILDTVTVRVRNTDPDAGFEDFFGAALMESNTSDGSCPSRLPKWYSNSGNQDPDGWSGSSFYAQGSETQDFISDGQYHDYTFEFSGYGDTFTLNPDKCYAMAIRVDPDTGNYHFASGDYPDTRIVKDFGTVSPIEISDKSLYLDTEIPDPVFSIANSSASIPGYDSYVDLTSPDYDEIFEEVGTTTLPAPIPFDLTYDISDYSGIGKYAPVGGSFDRVGVKIYDASASQDTAPPVFSTSTVIINDTDSFSWSKILPKGTYYAYAFLSSSASDQYYPDFLGSRIRFHSVDNSELTGINPDGTPVPVSERIFEGADTFEGSDTKSRFTEIINKIKNDSFVAPFFTVIDGLSSIDVIPTDPGNVTLEMGDTFGTFTVLNTAEARSFTHEDDLSILWTVFRYFMWIVFGYYIIHRYRYVFASTI